MSTPKNEVVTETVPAVKEKGRQLATTVPAPYYAAIDGHHWDARKSLSEIVREALDDYVAKHGINVSGE